ncbi:MAG: transposase [Myxococcales bacterium]|nr:transposase [Myxococcales bacterium]
MSRPPRIDHPGARHHVMNRGARREPIFTDARSCALFLTVLSALPERFSVRVHGYALMPNHFHLLLETPRGNLSRAMQHLGATYTRELNLLHSWDGPVFRGRFRNRLVEDDDYWRHLLAYVHLNPVRANLVRAVDDAEWTSHDAYVGVAKRPEWLTTSDLLDQFGGVEGYRQYVWEMRVGRAVAPESFDEDAMWTAPFTTRPEEEPAAPDATSAEDALADVERVTGVAPSGLGTRRGRGGNRATWLAAWWLERAAGLPHREIAERLGTDRATVSRWIRRVGRSGDDPQLTAWREALRK